MTPLSRFLVAGSFVLSLSAFVLAYRGAPSSLAVAGAPVPSDLGPAEGLLLGEKGKDEPVRVTIADGRIAWGDRSTNRVWSVAAVDIDTVMKKILEGSSYMDARREAQEGAQAEEAEFNKRLAAIRERFSLTENAPPPPEAQQELMALQQEYQRWLEGVRRRDEKLGAEQFEQGYRELVAAVETVSEKESIDIVFRFYPTAREFKAERMGEALSQIQARTFLKYPEAIDITPEVMKALNLSE
jgi:Skp family chaperone for outer membrane proteins